MPHAADDAATEPLPTATALAEFARSLRDTRKSMPQTLDEILRTSIALIPTAGSGAITTLSKGERTVVASSDATAERLCTSQYELGEGPIATEIRHLPVVVATDLHNEHRWPTFAALSVAAGMRSLVAFQLFNNADDIGALVLYSTEVNAFDADTVAVGEALAAHAALALLSTQENDQFRSGLASRDIIGQAKGMIMERYNINAAQAFDILAKLSQQQNQPLHRLSRELVETDHPTT